MTADMLLANALDGAAGPDGNADTDFDVRLQDVPLNNRRPDVTVYRAETIDVTPTRPEHVLLVVEVVSPGSSRLISTPGLVSSSIGVSSRPPPARPWSTRTSSTQRPAATGTAKSSPAS